MKTLNYYSWKNFFNLSYLITFTILLFLGVGTNMLSQQLEFNYLMIGIVFIAFGLRFDLFDNRWLPKLTRRFNSHILNQINFWGQWFVLVLLTQDVFTNNYVLKTWLAHSSFFVSTLWLILLMTLLSISSVFTITLVRPHHRWSLIVVFPLLIILVYEFMINIFAGYTYSAVPIPHSLLFWRNSLLACMVCMIIPFIYISIRELQLKPIILWNWTGLKKKRILFGSMIIFLLVIFYLDSALWLHPLKTWRWPNLEQIVFSVRSGVLEELLYRGLFLSLGLSFVKKYSGYGFAIWGSSIAFGLMHVMNLASAPQHWQAVLLSTIDAMGIGVFFAVLYLITDNLLLVILIHTLWDLCQNAVTGSGNMSVNGGLGLLIVLSVFVLSVLYSSWLAKRYLTTRQSQLG